MPFTTERYSTSANSSAATILLPDGRVLFIAYGSAQVLVPDEFGSYENGTFVDIADPPYSAQYTNWVITNQGRVLIWPGEFGTLKTLLPPGVNRVMEFDPRDDSWSVYEFAQTAAPAVCDNGTHRVPHVRLTPDGRVFGANARAINADVDMVENTVEHRTAVFGVNGLDEECLAQGQDGRFYGVRSFSYGNSGEYPRLSTNRLTPQVLVVDPTGAQAPKILPQGVLNYRPGPTEVVYQPSNSQYMDHDWWRWQDSDMLGKLATYEGIGYETGSMIYNPYLNRFVYAAGNGGIYLLDPQAADSNISGPGASIIYVAEGYQSPLPYAAAAENIRNAALTRAAEFPITPTSGSNNIRTPMGTVASVDSGKNGYAIDTQTTLTVNMGPGVTNFDVSQYIAQNSTYGAYFWITHSNNQRYTLFVATGVSFPESGVFTLSGVSYNRTTINVFDENDQLLSNNPGRGLSGDLSTPFTASDRVFFKRPFWDAREGFVCLLPNGESIIVGGISDGPLDFLGFNKIAGLFKWNGSSTVLDFLTDDGESIALWGPNKNYPISDFELSITPLPDETLMFSGKGVLKFYHPTTTEKTPRANSRPVIQSDPGMLTIGGSAHLTVLRPNGDNEHVQQNDDYSPIINSPVVTLKSTQDNKVYHCRAHGFTYRGIHPSTSGQVAIDIPNTVPVGEYELRVHAGLLVSDPILVQTISVGDPVFVNSYG